MEENNKLIAEFMGDKNYLYCNNNNARYFILTNDKGKELKENYNSDWNLLMKVVEKIFSHNHNFKHHQEYRDCISNLEWALTQVDKEILISSCLKYINWYNNQEVK